MFNTLTNGASDRHNDMFLKLQNYTITFPCRKYQIIFDEEYTNIHLHLVDAVLISKWPNSAHAKRIKLAQILMLVN